MAYPPQFVAFSLSSPISDLSRRAFHRLALLKTNNHEFLRVWTQALSPPGSPPFNEVISFFKVSFLLSPMPASICGVCVFRFNLLWQSVVLSNKLPAASGHVAFRLPCPVQGPLTLDGLVLPPFSQFVSPKKNFQLVRNGTNANELMFRFAHCC